MAQAVMASGEGPKESADTSDNAGDRDREIDCIKSPSGAHFGCVLADCRIRTSGPFAAGFGVERRLLWAVGPVRAGPSSELYSSHVTY